jgi:hypothetical protein
MCACRLLAVGGGGGIGEGTCCWPMSCGLCHDGMAMDTGCGDQCVVGLVRDCVDGDTVIGSPHDPQLFIGSSSSVLQLGHLRARPASASCPPHHTHRAFPGLNGCLQSPHQRCCWGLNRLFRSSSSLLSSSSWKGGRSSSASPCSSSPSKCTKSRIWMRASMRVALVPFLPWIPFCLAKACS